MKYLSNGTRKINFFSFKDLIQNIFWEDQYILLINILSEKKFFLINEKIDFLLSPNCKEIYFIGPLAERLHDIFDEYIEDHGFFDVVTTYENGNSIDDECFYFTKVAGGGNILNMFVLTDNDEYIENKLKEYFISK